MQIMPAHFGWLPLSCPNPPSTSDLLFLARHTHKHTPVFILTKENRITRHSLPHNHIIEKGVCDREREIVCLCNDITATR